MAVDESQGAWRFMSKRQKILVKAMTIALYPWILYDKLRRKRVR